MRAHSCFTFRNILFTTLPLLMKMFHPEISSVFCYIIARACRFCCHFFIFNIDISGFDRHFGKMAVLGLTSIAVALETVDVLVVIFMYKQSSLFCRIIQIVSLWIVALDSEKRLNKVAPHFHYPFCML